MADDLKLTPELLVHQLRQYVEGLRSAGIELLPKADPSQELPRSAIVAEAAAELALDEPASRRLELDQLAEEVAGCVRCKALASTRTQTVFGIGPLDAELCFIGEAPGEQEDHQGLPFVGPAGQLLDRIIAACGMSRADVAIINVLKCRPPGNRKPLADEAANCRGYLERQLELLRPKFLCALGATAAQLLLDTTAPIGKLRGRFHDFKGLPVICTYHPSYLNRLQEPEKTNKKRDVWDDMKRLLAKMGRDVPAK